MHHISSKTLKALSPLQFQELIKEEYNLTLASVLFPKEYNTLEILIVEKVMPRYIQSIVLARDYAEMVASDTYWTPLDKLVNM